MTIDEKIATLDAAMQRLAEVERERDEHAEKRSEYSAEAVSLRAMLTVARGERDDVREQLLAALAGIAGLKRERDEARETARTLVMIIALHPGELPEEQAEAFGAACERALSYPRAGEG